MANLPKILLVTDVPPCKNNTAGLVLDQLCRFLPMGSLVCAAVVNPFLHLSISPDLEWIPIKYIRKPREYWQIFPDRSLLHMVNNLVSCCMESYNEIFVVHNLVAEITSFAKKHHPELLWCVVQGQTEVRLAQKLSRSLGIPLYIQIWDPLYFWMDTHIPNKFMRGRIIKLFEKTLVECEGFFAASWAMAEAYHNLYGVRSVPFLPSIDERLALVPATNIHDGQDFVIGGAGKLYPMEVWEALFKALDKVEWRIHGKNVKIRLLAQDVQLHSRGKMHFEFLGWRSQEETIKLLADADVLYCPYWFNPYFETVTKLSFPGKLSTFLACGRPILFHGPINSSPAKFLRENNAGLICSSLDPAEIISALSRLATDADAYKRFTYNGRNALHRHLTLETLKKNFAEFLQIEESVLLDH